MYQAESAGRTTHNAGINLTIPVPAETKSNDNVKYSRITCSTRYTLYLYSNWLKSNLNLGIKIRCLKFYLLDSHYYPQSLLLTLVHVYAPYVRPEHPVFDVYDLEIKSSSLWFTGLTFRCIWCAGFKTIPVLIRSIISRISLLNCSSLFTGLEKYNIVTAVPYSFYMYSF